jgi:septal ring factor EnvC (AmiA/AmiB activator)
VPSLQARAQNLKSELAALATVRAEIDATKARQSDERDALRAGQARIAALIERKAALQQAASRTADENGKHLQALAAQAGSLRDLINRLGEEAPSRRAVAAAVPPAPRPEFAKPAHIRPFAAARGAMVVPVAGTLVRRYGAPDEMGAASRGLTYLTRPAAQVVAPFDGRVLFAGPFRGYGQILIIGHGDGYHSLLAGLDHVDSSVGQWLVAGEPVGTMADRADKPHLYLELRHNNQPINPLPWLPTLVEKVNG